MVEPASFFAASAPSLMSLLVPYHRLDRLGARLSSAKARLYSASSGSLVGGCRWSTPRILNLRSCFYGAQLLRRSWGSRNFFVRIKNARGGFLCSSRRNFHWVAHRWRKGAVHKLRNAKNLIFWHQPISFNALSYVFLMGCKAGWDHPPTP